MFNHLKRPQVELPLPLTDQVAIFRDHDDKIKIKDHTGQIREATTEEINEIERQLQAKIIK